MSNRFWNSHAHTGIILDYCYTESALAHSLSLSLYLIIINFKGALFAQEFLKTILSKRQNIIFLINVKGMLIYTRVVVVY